MSDRKVMNRKIRYLYKRAWVEDIKKAHFYMEYLLENLINELKLRGYLLVKLDGKDGQSSFDMQANGIYLVTARTQGIYVGKKKVLTMKPIEFRMDTK